jgi:hypothetical protein
VAATPAKPPRPKRNTLTKGKPAKTQLQIQLEAGVEEDVNRIVGYHTAIAAPETMPAAITQSILESLDAGSLAPLDAAIAKVAEQGTSFTAAEKAALRALTGITPTPPAPPKKVVAPEPEAKPKDKLKKAKDKTEKTPAALTKKAAAAAKKAEADAAKALAAAQDAAEAETVARAAQAELDRRKKAGKGKGVPKPPKTKAPAAEAGAADVGTTESSVRLESKRPTKAQLLQSLVIELEGVLGDGFTSDQTTDLLNAIVRSTPTETSAISEVVSDIELSGTNVSPKIRNALRGLAKNYGIQPKPEPVTAAQYIDIHGPMALSLEDETTENPGIRGLIEDTLSATRKPGESEAGAVLRALANSSYVTLHQRWLARLLAPVMDKRQYSLSLQEYRSKIENGRVTEGTHNDIERLITIYTASPDVILHEALHGATVSAITGLLNVPGQNKLHDDWKKFYSHALAYRNKIDWGKINPNYREDARNAFEYGLKNEKELAAMGITNAVSREVWAQIPPVPGYKGNNFWNQFKNLLSDLYKTMLGADISQRSFLMDLMDLTAETVNLTNSVSDRASAKVVYDAKDLAAIEFIDAESKQVVEGMETLVDAPPDVTPPTAKERKKKPTAQLQPVNRFQRFVEVTANSTLGLEKAEQEVIANGGNVTPENSPYFAMRKFTADTAENKDLDNQETVEPLKRWLSLNWRKFGSGTNSDKFRKDLDKFLQHYHILNERNPTIWAETVELEGGRNLDRALLIQSAYDGEITGKQLNQQLISLANRHATIKLDEWSKKSDLAMDNAKLRESLADLAQLGYTPESLAELNVLVQNVRDRARQRMIQAGIVVEDSTEAGEGDPFSERGWEWYVPLKGSLSAPDGAGDYDIGSLRGSTKAFRDSNLATLEGRQTNAGNALAQLVADMNDASTFAAEKGFKGTLFEFATDEANTSIVKPKVVKYTGTPKAGYTYTKRVVNEKGKVKYVKTWRRNLPRPVSGFVYNDGTTHFVVYLPRDSQLNRGATGLRRVLTPYTISEKELVGKSIEAVGTGTNFIARAMTTWNPVWQASVGFLRDTTTLPFTVATGVYRYPWEAGGFAGRYTGNLIKNTAALANIPQDINAIWGNKDKLRAYAKENPTSFPARVLAYRNAGGSTEFAQGFNVKRADDELFSGLDPSVIDRAGDVYGKWNEVTGNFAALLELVGRVSAYEALVGTGMTEQEAAAQTKGALDYGQSGEWGRLVNAFHAFYRVGATSADVMRRNFTKKTGGVDYKKLAAWTPVAGAMGYAAYQLISMMLGVDDEDGKPRISKLDIGTLLQRFPFPGPDGKIYSFPIGLGLPQLLLAPGIIAAAYSEGHISIEEGAEAYYDVAKRNAPLQPMGVREGQGVSGFITSLLGGMVTPTILKPPVEITANTNAFGNPIRTDWGTTKKNRSEQGMPATGQEWKDMAMQLYDWTGGAVDMYPEEIAHYSRGYLGQLSGETVRWTVDNERKEREGLDSRAVATSLRTAVTDEDFYYRNETREVKDELEESFREMEAAVARGANEAQWLSRNPGAAKRMAAWKELDKAQSAYYEELAAIRADKLMSPERRRLRRKRADSTLRQAVERAQRSL